MIEVSNKTYLEALNRVAASDDGKIVLSYLMRASGWDSTMVSTEEPKVTQYYAARRGLYGFIRKDIRDEYLKSIEFDYQHKAVEHDRGNERKHSISRKRTAADE